MKTSAELRAREIASMEKARNEYIGRMVNVQTMLERIKDLTDHAIDPEDIHWGDVANMGRVEMSLTEICEYL